MMSEEWSDKPIELLAEVDATVVSPRDQGRSTQMIRLQDFEPAISIDERDIDAYLRRFSTLFLSEDHVRLGGVGKVIQVINSMGEKFALKISSCMPSDAVDEDANNLSEESINFAHDLFMHEYRGLQQLSGVKGFPKLYGRGFLDGSEVIVMEWIEGLTLDKARKVIAVDSSLRVPSLLAARIGRDLFGLLSRMQMLDSGLVHRDISLSNVMICTSVMSLEDQINEGVFDLRMLDFGSSQFSEAYSSITESCEFDRGATPDFAAPEMLDDDIAGASSMRQNSAVDVYAAASVIFTLLCGSPPYDLAQVDCDESFVSPRNRKLHEKPKKMQTVHMASEDIALVLAREPEVAVAVGHALSGLSGEASKESIRDSLILIDSQLEGIIYPCLNPKQSMRPSADQTFETLSGFISNYAFNVESALKGEPLEFLSSSPHFHGRIRWTSHRKKVIRNIGKSIMAAIWLAAVIATGVLVANQATWIESVGVESSSWLSFFAISGSLALPACVGLLARWDQNGGLKEFIRGSVADAVLCGLFCLIVAFTDVAPSEVAHVLQAAALLCLASSWGVMVFDFAFASPRSHIGKMLPSGAAMENETKQLPPSLALPGGSDL